MSVILFVVMSSIILILVLAETVLSDKELLLDSQPSSIESGFEKMWHVMFISSPFFMLAVLFVLFDMELILVIPCILYCSKPQALHFLLVVVMMTLLLEWVLSGLKWHL